MGSVGTVGIFIIQASSLWQCDTNSNKHLVIISCLVVLVLHHLNLVIFMVRGLLYCNRLWAPLTPDLFESVSIWAIWVIWAICVICVICVKPQTFICASTTQHPYLMTDKAILASLLKLNGSNWFKWKKEAETFLLLAGLDGIIDAEDVPMRAKSTE